MIRYVVGSAVLSGILAISIGESIQAQSMVAAVTPVQHNGYLQQSPSTKSSVLDRPLSVDVSGMTLDRALQEVQEKSGVQIIYSPQLIPAGRKVSVSAKSVTLGTVLGDLLRGTSVTSQLSPKGQVMLVPAVSREQTGIITGRVLHAKTKQPIVGARISVDDANATAESGGDGTFRLEATAGQHRITVKAVGFTRHVKTVTVVEGETLTIEVVLEPSASVLDEVVVTGSVVATERKAIPTPITVITAEEIEKRGITRIDQFFRGEVPGVVSLDVGSARYIDDPGAMQTSQVYVRGASATSGVGQPPANGLKTYIDGVELLDHNMLGTIDPGNIERIEIVTGPQAATLYGSGAMGGVMQIFTKKGAGQGSTDFMIGFRYGILESNLSSGKTPSHTHTFSVNGGSGPEFSYSGTLSYNYIGQWRPEFFSRDAGGSIGVTHERENLVVNGNVSVTSSRNGTTEIQSFRSVTMSESGLWEPDPYVATLNRKVAESDNQTLTFNIDYRPWSSWQHHFVVGRSGSRYAIVPQLPKYRYIGDSLLNVSTSSGQRTSASYHTTMITGLGPHFNSTLSVGMNGSRADRVGTRGCIVSESDQYYAPCYSGSNTSVSRSVGDRSWGGFGQLRVGVFDQVFLTLGLRGEKNPTYGERHTIDWTPTNGFALTHVFGEVTLKLLGSYGRATRAPELRQREEQLVTSTRYAVPQYILYFANPYLRPEYSQGPQGGIELYVGNRGSLTLNHYRQTVTDLIQSVYVDSFVTQSTSNGADVTVRQAQFQNVGKIRQQGWEATAALNLGVLGFKGTYSWNDSRILESRTASWQPGQLFWGIPTHTGNVTATYAHKGTSVSVVTNVIGRVLLRYGNANLFLTDGSQNRLPMYVAMAHSVFPSWGGWSQPGYAKVDVAMSHRISAAASLMLQITNAGNSYVSDEGFANPSLGRRTLFGLTLRALP